MVKSSRVHEFPYPEFTIDEIAEIIDGGRCSITDIPFDIDTTRKSPWLGSPDRIDPSRGYTKDNVQWVCWMFNAMKSDYSMEEVRVFVTALKEGDF